MEASGYASTLQRLLCGILPPGCHQPGHFILSELDLSPAESGKANVGNLELVGGSAHFGEVYFVIRGGIGL